MVQVPMVWYKDAGPMEKEPIVEVPRLQELAGPELLEELLAIGHGRSVSPECRGGGSDHHGGGDCGRPRPIRADLHPPG